MSSLVLVALTLAFGISTAVFNSTYRQQAEVDARRSNGADVTVTDAPGAAVGPQAAAALAATAGAKPQDVKLAPGGRLFYVADMVAGGVWLVDADRSQVTGFLATGAGAHGLYVSRNSRLLYVSNRDMGSVSVLSLASHRVVATWRLPGGGSPDMGGVSADGRVRWLSGRHHGPGARHRHRQRPAAGPDPGRPWPHGLCVYPQPGRYSLGHTGVFR